MEARGLVIPAWVRDRALVAVGGDSGVVAPEGNPPSPPWKGGDMSGDDRLGRGFEVPLFKGDLGGAVSLSNGGSRFLQPTDDVIDLDRIRSNPANILWQNPEAALLDLGDGVALYEFRSKGNTLSMKVLEGLDAVMTLVERGEFRGLVIGNGSDNFCGGANLAEMAAMAQSDMALRVESEAELVEKSAIGGLITQFQTLLNRVYYSPYPVVGAIQGRALGGGAEMVMACPRIVAAAESYIGLVELSVGLIPGAGGIMRMVMRATQRAASESPSHILPFLQKVFETIAMSKVSSSAQEAQELGFLPADAVIIMNGDRRLFVAKEEVLRLDREGYTPPPVNNAIMLLGKPARAMFAHAAYIFQQGRFASEHDRFLATKLAYVMTGGELSGPTIVPESYLLQLERETFVPLLQQPKTQARIAAMLTQKKPLRN
jgi:3-hydroxyacyl-CoA dehydrogenase